MSEREKSIVMQKSFSVQVLPEFSEAFKTSKSVSSKEASNT